MKTKKLNIEDKRNNKILSKEDLFESEEKSSKKNQTPINETESKEFFIYENFHSGVKIQIGSATLNAERLSNLAYQFLVLTIDPIADPEESIDYIK